MLSNICRDRTCPESGSGQALPKSDIQYVLEGNRKGYPHKKIVPFNYGIFTTLFLVVISLIFPTGSIHTLKPLSGFPGETFKDTSAVFGR